jgi:hypothetical protein
LLPGRRRYQIEIHVRTNLGVPFGSLVGVHSYLVVWRQSLAILDGKSIEFIRSLFLNLSIQVLDESITALDFADAVVFEEIDGFVEDTTLNEKNILLRNSG